MADREQEWCGFPTGDCVLGDTISSLRQSNTRLREALAELVRVHVQAQTVMTGFEDEKVSMTDERWPAIERHLRENKAAWKAARAALAQDRVRVEEDGDGTG